MTSNSLPHGMTDVDYEAIEAAVTETVRGRWFLAEFARRNRASEVKVMLDAMGRLEALVTAGQNAHQPALPPPASADPSIRLLVQRIKDIAAGLDGLAREMRAENVDERFCDSAETQARAIAGLMRSGTVPKAAVEPKPSEVPLQIAASTVRPVEADVTPPRPMLRVQVESRASADTRLLALSEFDNLPLAQKLALFT